MKKLNILATALMGILALSSCESDRDSNPIVSVPKSFELLVPEIGSNVVNLKNSESIKFQAKAAPDYGFPTETTYWIEISEDQTFADAAKIATTDTKGKSIIYDAPANEIDLGIMKIRNITEDLPTIDWDEVITLFVRMVACPTNMNKAENYVYSNVQSFKVTAYYLKEALPELWYMVGDFIGDGSWASADYNNIGKGMIPMYVKPNEEYNRFTGKGTIEYVGYFYTTGESGMKILSPRGVSNHPTAKNISPWMYGMCGDGHTFSDGEGYVSRNGGDDKNNITVDAPGFYRLTLDDTKEGDEELKIEAYEPDEAPAVFSTIKIGDVTLTAMNTKPEVENHDWFGTITLSASAELLLESDNGTTWGTDAFPYGIATVGGNKIPAEKGSYQIFFNDITGAFMFTEIQE